MKDEIRQNGQVILSSDDGISIPMIYNNLVGVNGIAWATPVADTGAMLCAILRFIPFWKKLKAEQERDNLI